ncbi:DUF805 domain-containing protein [Buttiauxella sp. 3AFRM03]|uniref:DUF805 domain-containing protein n=1 Tax=Buttiauxella sp. 3AFRM03 TaxID=2479367 RepID=UPI000EF83547|nr:DUF805 domain-containing protein [Buttiauxella sp. 3AFRM03]AYN26390.1 DUF805 domain-containing protein [Buttiauxella sp. 3AFRM03]
MFFITNGIDGYRKVFCYKGVADRKSWLFFVLFQFLFLMLYDLVNFARALDNGALDDEAQASHVAILAVELALFYAATIYSCLAYLAITVRRFHDFGLSGWWVIPYFGLMVLVLLVIFAVSVLIFGILLEDVPIGSIATVVGFIVCKNVVSISFILLLALPKSKIENNKYRPADSISIPATDEAMS